MRHYILHVAFIVYAIVPVVKSGSMPSSPCCSILQQEDGEKWHGLTTNKQLNNDRQAGGGIVRGEEEKTQE